MNKLIVVLCVWLLITNKTVGQDCNCPESFEWMVTTFEANDAGFQDVILRKGTDEYRRHSSLYREKVKEVHTLNDCRNVLNEWLHFFRSGHTWVALKENGSSTSVDNNPLTTDEIRDKYKNERKTDLTEKKLISLLQKKVNINAIEGIWETDKYRIGIVGDANNRKFTAFIIKADSIYWMPQQVKAELTPNDDAKTFTAHYSTRDHLVDLQQVSFSNKASTILSMGYACWTRIYPKTVYSLYDSVNLGFQLSRNPFLTKLSDKTVYLRIPSFARNKKQEIDKLLHDNHTLITSTPNLIIDIRNGTGGSDASFRNIIPYLYTNPIRQMGVTYYSSELNAQEVDYWSTLSSDTANISLLKNQAANMRANPGKFVTFWDKVNTDTMDNVYSYPQKVAVICNHQNASADEQFLMVAKQSQKVKVYGVPTKGALDISNVAEKDFPNGKLILAYSISKSFRLPQYWIDGVGIQPDYYLDETVPDFEWIQYVHRMVENLNFSKRNY